MDNSNISTLLLFFVIIFNSYRILMYLIKSIRVNRIPYISIDEYTEPKYRKCIGKVIKEHNITGRSADFTKIIE